MVSKYNFVYLKKIFFYFLFSIVHSEKYLLISMKKVYNTKEKRV
jgi:hypothetical protein